MVAVSINLVSIDLERTVKGWPETSVATGWSFAMFSGVAYLEGQ